MGNENEIFSAISIVRNKLQRKEFKNVRKVTKVINKEFDARYSERDVSKILNRWRSR